MMMEDHGTTWKDYLAFAGVIIFITGSSLLWSNYHNYSGLETMRIFMGVFFLVFSFFKLLDIKGFAMSFIGYDIIAKRVNWYAYLYPFIELGLALAFLLNITGADWITAIISTVGAIGVGQQLFRKSKIKCACLGTYIKLPLSMVSLTEDLLMGVMAIIMIIN